MIGRCRWRLRGGRSSSCISLNAGEVTCNTSHRAVSAGSRPSACRRAGARSPVLADSISRAPARTHRRATGAVALPGSASARAARPARSALRYRVQHNRPRNTHTNLGARGSRNAQAPPTSSPRRSTARGPQAHALAQHAKPSSASTKPAHHARPTTQTTKHPRLPPHALARAHQLASTAKPGARPLRPRHTAPRQERSSASHAPTPTPQLAAVAQRQIAAPRDTARDQRHPPRER